MNHQTYKEWLMLAIYNELGEQEQLMLNKHISECEECRLESQQLYKLHSVFNEAKFVTPDDKLLSEVRQELKAAIRIVRNKSSFMENAIGWIKNASVKNYKYALAGASMLIIGLTLGYIMFSGKTLTTNESPEMIPASESSQFSGEDIRISNLRFIDSESEDGEISFSFDAVRPVKMKGNINDKFIQKVLAYSVVNEKNDGVRIRTINTIAESTPAEKLPSQKIKESLISALKFDDNAGVRREALLVLQKFPADNDILEAFIYVLNNDKNSGLRIAAVNAITPSKLEGKQMEEDVIKVLKQRSSMDENEYIRMRAKTVLQEVVQQ